MALGTATPSLQPIPVQRSHETPLSTGLDLQRLLLVILPTTREIWTSYICMDLIKAGVNALSTLAGKVIHGAVEAVTAITGPLKPQAMHAPSSYSNGSNSTHHSIYSAASPGVQPSRLLLFLAVGFVVSSLLQLVPVTRAVDSQRRARLSDSPDAGDGTLFEPQRV